MRFEAGLRRRAPRLDAGDDGLEVRDGLRPANTVHHRQRFEKPGGGGHGVHLTGCLAPIFRIEKNVVKNQKPSG